VGGMVTGRCGQRGGRSGRGHDNGLRPRPGAEVGKAVATAARGPVPSPVAAADAHRTRRKATCAGPADRLRSHRPASLSQRLRNTAEPRELLGQLLLSAGALVAERSRTGPRMGSWPCPRPTGARQHRQRRPYHVADAHRLDPGHPQITGSESRRTRERTKTSRVLERLTTMFGQDDCGGNPLACGVDGLQ
jgi:hypothetical protein